MPVVKNIPGYETVLTCMFKIKKLVPIKGVTGAYGFDLMINKSPTGNCQLSSLGYVNYVLHNTQNNIKDVNDIVRECFALSKHAPKLIMLDVNEMYVSGVETCFNVILKQPYVSTNNSKMCAFLVKFA
jgi:hypothetical protein